MLSPNALRQWRGEQRERLVSARLALETRTLLDFRLQIDAHLEQTFPGLGNFLIAFCWPFQNEYDPRFLMRRLRERGARTALPVVLEPRQPMIFRVWAPGEPLAKGVYDIPYPASGDAVVPEVALVPMNGFDDAGYRLGYGGGFFDRTLAALRAEDPQHPVVIGVTYEIARMQTIDPQAYDIPMDYIATEQGIYQRIDGRLVLLERSAVAPMISGYASPACLAHEIAPGYFGDG